MEETATPRTFAELIAEREAQPRPHDAIAATVPGSLVGDAARRGLAGTALTVTTTGRTLGKFGLEISRTSEGEANADYYAGGERVASIYLNATNANNIDGLADWLASSQRMTTGRQEPQAISLGAKGQGARTNRMLDRCRRSGSVYRTIAMYLEASGPCSPAHAQAASSSDCRNY